MKSLSLSLILLTVYLFGCRQSKDMQADNSSENKIMVPMTKEILIGHVKLAINPKFQDWVLFQNGTYLILDNADKIADIEAEAMNLMKEFGPVSAGGPAGDFSVTHLNQTEGWVVSGHGYGMYTYVNPKELDKESPTDIEIGLYGRSKRDLDGETPKIIHINRNEK